MLERAGHTVHCACSGDAALELLKLNEYQVLISDWMMEGMSGPELCQRVRSADRDGYMYLILLTCKNTCSDRISAFGAGVDDFIAKPFNEAELLSRVRVAERVVRLESADLTIFALANLAESRDQDTGAHLYRVQRYCRIIAQAAGEMGLYPNEIDAQFIRLIYDTSPLHDIGKVAIPDSVLLRPGKLSTDEFEVMKTHTTIGATTLEKVLKMRPGARFLRVARDIAEHHHERWDGTGYPCKLAGTDIPLAARIVAIADVFDALSSKRAYKPAFTREHVKQTIVDGRGTHFEPALVDVFLQVEPQLQAILEASRHQADVETALSPHPIPWTENGSKAAAA
jgi:putative two-component system response regulator